MGDELAGQHPPLASPPGGAQAPDSVGSDPARRGPEHGVRGGTSAGGEDSRDTRRDRATRYLETARGILSCFELAPLLADRVTAAEASIFKGEFSSARLDETLLLKLHRRLAGDPAPDWAGRWRDIDVTVGRLAPPSPFQISMLMRGYALDMQARWPVAAGGATRRRVPQDNLHLTINARAELFPRHQPITTGILAGGLGKITRHDNFQFLRRTLRTGADAAAREWSELPHRADGAGFPFRRIAWRPSARPRHHRIAGGRRPTNLGSEPAPRHEGRRRTGQPGRHRITADTASGPSPEA